MYKDPDLLIQHVRQKLQQFGMTPGIVNPPVVLALSSGPDSTALLTILQRLRDVFHFSLSAAHLNHGLRGAESDTDQAFALDLCRQLEIPLDRTTLDFPELQKQTGRNLHALARQQRYRFLEQAAAERQATRVLTGHHLDDQVETFLLALFRGAGRRGLSSMPESRPLGNVTLCRPLLQVSHEQILGFLHTNEIAYRQDSSNKDTSFTRNWLRHRILPQLEKRRPNLKRRLMETATLLREEEDFLDTVFRDVYQSLTRDHAPPPAIPGMEILWSCPIRSLEGLHPTMIRRLIRRLVAQYTPADRDTAPGKITEQILDCLVRQRPQWEIRLGPTLKIARRYQHLMVFAGQEIEPPDDWILLPESGECLVNALDGILRLEQKTLEKNVVAQIKNASRQNPHLACFDAARIRRPLALRRRKPGDRMPVLGLGGTRKIKDLMMDARLTVEQRKQPRLLVSENHILWVIGCAINEHFKVTEQTGEMLQVELVPSHCQQRTPTDA